MRPDIKKTALILFLIINHSYIITAQTFELDRVKLIPAIDESNMKIIASSIWFLYVEAMKSPQKYTNPKSMDNTVYTYLNIESTDRYEKIMPVKGRLYTPCYKEDLDLNNRLLFNLKFDVTGKLFVPASIFVISTQRVINDEANLATTNWAFELMLTDSIKAVFDKVKLEQPVLSGKALESGEFKPVEVLVPFNLTHLANSQNLKAILEIRNKKFQLFSEEKGQIFENDTNLVKAVLEFMEYKLLQYKNGKFKLVLMHHAEGLQIDLNIKRNPVWNSPQTKNFPTFWVQVISCEGEGEKTRNYKKVNKNIEQQLGRPETP